MVRTAPHWHRCERPPRPPRQSTKHGPSFLPLTAIARYRGEPPLNFGPWSAVDLVTRRTACVECLCGLEAVRIVVPSCALGPIVARDSCGSCPTGGAIRDLSGPGAACCVLAAGCCAMAAVFSIKAVHKVIPNGRYFMYASPLV